MKTESLPSKSTARHTSKQNDGKLEIRLREYADAYEHLIIQSVDMVGNLSKAIAIANPFFHNEPTPTPTAAPIPTPEPVATPQPTKPPKPTKTPTGNDS